MGLLVGLFVGRTVGFSVGLDVGPSVGASDGRLISRYRSATLHSRGPYVAPSMGCLFPTPSYIAISELDCATMALSLVVGMPEEDEPLAARRYGPSDAT